MTTEIELDYTTLVSPIVKNFPKVYLDSFIETKVKDLAKLIAEKKKSESSYNQDFNNLEKRFITGLLGEAALEQLLSVSIIDWEVGDSNKYDVGDLNKIGIDCGVKTVEHGKFPLIHANTARDEIVIIKHPTELKFIICGVYKKEILRKYQSRDLVVDPLVRQSKTAFYGIPFGIIFKNLIDLKKIVHNT